MQVPGTQDHSAAGGVQEGSRWRARHHGTPPTIQVIEPGKKDERAANTPFGFARALVEAVEPVFDGEGA